MPTGPNMHAISRNRDNRSSNRLLQWMQTPTYRSSEPRAIVPAKGTRTHLISAWHLEHSLLPHRAPGFVIYSNMPDVNYFWRHSVIVTGHLQ